MSISLVSGASSDIATVDPTSKAVRVTNYDSLGNYNGEKATYRASTIIPLVVAVTVNVPFLNIIGSATKTVIVKRIAISGGTQTAMAYNTTNLERLSTATTGGTSTTLVATQTDTNNAAATAVVKAYTVAGTKGTLVGTLATCKTLWQAATPVAGGAGLTRDYVYDFGDMPETRGIVLRGVTQELALIFPVVLASAGSVAIDIEWTEE